ncbi:MAG: hypothetical protein VX498_09855 [Myxococcota bacterium]|nr:hypothetical protein [Myxococcota bacterium]
MRLRRLPARALWGVAGAVVLVFGLRLRGQPLQPYGSNSAEYIEHAVRLELQLLWRDWSGSLLGYLGAADGHIVTHPPGLHLITSLVGGQEAESVLWTGLVWLGLLSLGLALCAHAILPGAGRAGALAALLFPAALGAATRYHYDLPMTALLWLATGVLLLSRRRLLLAPLAGLLFALACFVKWTALPFGLLMIAAATCTRTGRGRVVPSLVALSVAGLLVVGYLDSAGTSFAAGSLAVDTGDRVGEGSSLVNLLLSFGDRLVAEISHPQPARLAWYFLALPGSLLGLLGLAMLLPLLLAWWRSGRPGAGLLVGVVAGQVALLALGLRVLDERFALTFVPALLLAAALGWSRGPGVRRWGPWVLAVGLLLHLEFHLAPSGPWNQEITVFAEHEEVPPIRFRTAFLGNSFEQRGWSARADTEDPRPEGREAIWLAISDCGVSQLGVVEGLDDQGDAWWLRYRTRLAQVRGERSEDLLVLLHGRLGEVRYWWPDPDTEQDSGRFDALGFNLDQLPEELLSAELSKEELGPALSRLGLDRRALDYFQPRLALSRIPPAEDSPIDASWSLLHRIEPIPWGEPVGLYARPGACH